MALGRKAAAATKIVLVVPKGIIDPAVDLENSDINKYYDSLFDMKYLKIYPGQEPTYFTIRPLTRRQKDACDALAGQRNIASWYVRCGLLKIQNYKIYDENDNPREAPNPVLEKYGDVGEIAPEKWLDEVSFTIDVRDALFICIAKLTEAKIPLSVQLEAGCGPPE